MIYQTNKNHVKQNNKATTEQIIIQIAASHLWQYSKSGSKNKHCKNKVKLFLYYVCTYAYVYVFTFSLYIYTINKCKAGRI